MDSLIIDGTDRYAPDDEILLQPGLHVMTGYYNRCSAEKEIWVELADDLGMQFSREMTWCPGDALDLSLPVDSAGLQDRKSTRLNSSHVKTSYAVFCLK